MNDLLTIEEAAERCRLSVNTLRWMRAQGTGPKTGKLGRRIFYREADLEAWIDAQFEKDQATA